MRRAFSPARARRCRTRPSSPKARPARARRRRQSPSTRPRARARAGPFIVVDCGAILPVCSRPSSSATRRAPSRAPTPRARAFEAADGGTIFLDEIGELLARPAAQVPCASSRRSRSKRIGTATFKTVDVRVIAATNRNLREEVNAKRFRSDLYYRLAVIEVHLLFYASAARTSRLVGKLLDGLGPGGGRRRRCARPSRSRTSRATTSRATCVSCATTSSAACAEGAGPARRRRRRRRRRQRARARLRSAAPRRARALDPRVRASLPRGAPPPPRRQRSAAARAAAVDRMHFTVSSGATASGDAGWRHLMRPTHQGWPPKPRKSRPGAVVKMIVTSLARTT